MLERPLFVLALVSSAMACSTRSSVSSDAGDGGLNLERTDAGNGAPYLTQLSVSSSPDARAPLTLVPPFSSDVFDYYVRCAEGPDCRHGEDDGLPGGS